MFKHGVRYGQTDLQRGPITEHHSGSGGWAHVAFWAAPGKAQWPSQQPLSVKLPLRAASQVGPQ